MISFVYTYESMYMLTKVLQDDQVSWANCFELGERGAESGESTEQKEKMDFLAHLYHHNHLAQDYIGLVRSGASQNISFSSADYSQVVYSPPETIVSSR